MASTPFKMKGSPMQRNFGIGSPAKDKDKDKEYQKNWQGDKTTKESFEADLKDAKAKGDKEMVRKIKMDIESAKKEEKRRKQKEKPSKSK